MGDAILVPNAGSSSLESFSYQGQREGRGGDDVVDAGAAREVTDRLGEA